MSEEYFVTQTTKNSNVPLSRPGRPGQRQQERLQRQARRKRRIRILISSILAVVIVIAAVVFLILDSRHNADVAALNDAHATATANAVSKSATATDIVQVTHAKATASAVNTQTASLVKDLQKQYPKGPDSPPVVTQPVQNGQNGLQYIVVKEGNGPVVKSGDTINFEYTGWLQGSGKKFDSSYDNGAQPIPVPVGQGQVIPGWDQGLIGMRIGETRRLIIPPALAYSSNPQKDQNGKVIIPANSTLIFDVTAVGYGQPQSQSAATGG
jgi:FKBP-type peptidyl-prolyl cis-trans isomerase